MKKTRRQMLAYALAALLAAGAPAAAALAQSSTVGSGQVQINQAPTNGPFGAFQIVQCDGPTLPGDASSLAYLASFKAQTGRDYVPCDFKGFMGQVQFLMNVMIVLGVLAGIGVSAYAGYLYITGTEKNISKAKEIFPKLAWGFILMLTAWFIVYQILVWLTGSGGYLAGGGS
ncbi:MAG: hypothetical protein KGI69_01915 [Patescibacteria group bacterium]|nr:hypothetical protein [Patescibacteria group bacterium]